MANEKFTALWDLSNQCEREIIRLCHEYQSKHNISETAFRILYTLHGNGSEITQADICNCLHFPRQSTNTALKKLEQDGIVEKVPVPGNQKSKYVVLTEKGQKLAEKIVAPMKKAEKEAYASFTEEEFRIYVAISQKRCTLFREIL